MKQRVVILLLLAAVVGDLWFAATCAGDTSAQVDFAHVVRPILSANCFSCHGRDEEGRKADLRLDERAPAIEYGAIVPGDVASSLLIERITADDLELRMPPADTGHRLTETEIELLKRWILQGAKYAEHWSFVAPTRSSIPSVITAEWPRNGIDFFTLRILEESGLKPSPQADPYTLVRRVYLDLIGLPPTPEVADRFAESPSEMAYEQLVDELLASPKFGEHWARVWLDLARYADTKGYEKDLPRDMWPFRDWMIRALNADMPYDQFTIEQLAGDLLPNPSREQLIASAFHRNTMSNDEGGTDDEEFRIAAVKDRVDTTMQVWMGLTVGCAKCHSHKYDPISHKEYYQLFAIFNQTADRDAFDEAPVLSFASDEQSKTLEDLQRKIASLEKTSPTESRTTNGAAAADSTLTKTNISSVASEGADQLTDLKQQLQELEEEITNLPVMRELPNDQQRKTHIHLRGNFLDLGEAVSLGVPEAFGSLDGEARPDRLALAKWLMSPENPLSARVAANRVWARFFGIGLVETEGDFGSQGAPPSHPQLLDWLAVELRDTHQWSLKRLCKAIVLSATYRQASTIEPARIQVDPRNRLVSRGPRFRLPAETVRDQALAVSGLLSPKMFGAPAMPAQPPGVWKTIYNARNWVTSDGEDRFRRALYTYWKRTSPYPAMLIFDAESRDVCTVRRVATNTPLQALVLMNDPVFLEAAAALARRMIDEGGSVAESRMAVGFRRLFVRSPSQSELARLEELRMAAERKFREKPESAADFLKSCNVSDELAAPFHLEEYASYVVVASVLLNLDEAITRN
jgi:hypothetical protein